MTHKYARIEYERQFLLKALPADLDPAGEFVRIIDLYLPGTRLRLREMQTLAGEVLTRKLTQKYRTPDLPPRQTIITNLYLTEDEAQVVDVSRAVKLIKRRYTYQAGRRYSIDVFEGPLSGLLLCDAEALTDQELLALPIPACAEKEVTDDPAFSGWALANLQGDQFESWFKTIF